VSALHYIALGYTFFSIDSFITCN